MRPQASFKYTNPPINEIVCGVFFEPLQELKAAHFGLLWEEFRPDFPFSEDHNLVAPVPQTDFENPDKLPLPRVWFIHKADSEIIQVQRNRFIHNWRKRGIDNKYPGYEKVISNLEEYFSRFEKFLSKEKIGAIVPKRYELTYINHILRGEGWETFDDLPKLFPDIFSSISRIPFFDNIRGLNWVTGIGLPDDSGEMRLSIRTAQQAADNRELISIEFHALSNSPYKPMRGWFNSTHGYIVRLFSDLVSVETQDKFWGQHTC